MSSRLNAAQRAAAITAIQNETLDVLVVGAGATGAGTALDAASRGLRVGLIDKGDIASGTSSKSSKLVHGGLRYLQNGDIGLVREALHERDLLLTTLAPHLVRPMTFLIPIRQRFWERPYLGTGVTIYDLLSGSKVLPRHRHVSRREAVERFPSLNPNAFHGAIEYHDAKMDDAGLAIAIVRTAAQEGARVAPYVSLVRSEGRDLNGVVRVRLRDEISHEEFDVQTRSVALCVGVWAPEVSGEFGEAEAAVSVTRSKGAHIRLPRSAIKGDVALTIRTKNSVLFVIPESDHWLIGTTDTEWTSDPDDVGPSDDDVRYLVDQLNGVLSHPIDERQVTWSYAGLRPLVQAEAVGGDTAKLTREHRIIRVAPSVLSIIGGKWTTYRVMARDLVDTILRELGEPEVPCRTEAIPLVNTRSTDIAELLATDPEWGQPLTDAPEFLKADVARACLVEGAIYVEDVVERRLRLPLHLDEVSDATIEDVTLILKSVGETPSGS